MARMADGAVIRLLPNGVNAKNKPKSVMVLDVGELERSARDAAVSGLLRGIWGVR